MKRVLLKKQAQTNALDSVCKGQWSDVDETVEQLVKRHVDERFLFDLRMLTNGGPDVRSSKLHSSC